MTRQKRTQTQRQDDAGCVRSADKSREPNSPRMSPRRGRSPSTVCFVPHPPVLASWTRPAPSWSPTAFFVAPHQYGIILPGVWPQRICPGVVRHQLPVYVVCLSFDTKVLSGPHFFQNLKRSVTADSFLHHLCAQLAKQFRRTRHAFWPTPWWSCRRDEWSITVVWAFLSEHARVLLFCQQGWRHAGGVASDPATSQGILISDDASRSYAQFINGAPRAPDVLGRICYARPLKKLLSNDRTTRHYRRFATVC